MASTVSRPGTLITSNSLSTECAAATAGASLLHASHQGAQNHKIMSLPMTESTSKRWPDNVTRPSCCNSSGIGAIDFSNSEGAVTVVEFCKSGELETLTAVVSSRD